MDLYQMLVDTAKEEKIEKFVVGGLITNSKGEILLLKRKKDDFLGGFFEISGGHVEKGETLYDTLMRETKEETNLDVLKVVRIS